MKIRCIEILFCVYVCVPPRICGRRKLELEVEAIVNPGAAMWHRNIFTSIWITGINSHHSAYILTLFSVSLFKCHEVLQGSSLTCRRLFKISVLLKTHPNHCVWVLSISSAYWNIFSGCHSFFSGLYYLFQIATLFLYFSTLKILFIETLRLFYTCHKFRVYMGR